MSINHDLFRIGSSLSAGGGFENCWRVGWSMALSVHFAVTFLENTKNKSRNNQHFSSVDTASTGWDFEAKRNQRRKDPKKKRIHLSLSRKKSTTNNGNSKDTAASTKRNFFSSSHPPPPAKSLSSQLLEKNPLSSQPNTQRKKAGERWSSSEQHSHTSSG